ncbi:UNVERIFIED_ORG: hypothetical protein B5F06_02610 [Lacrimispora saccharolytica]|nr:hypothetical protein CLOM621_05997 [Clostridium sp. M62/1]
MCCRPAGCRVDPYIAGLFAKEEARGRRTGRKSLCRAENRKKGFLSVCAGTIERHGCFAAEKDFQKKGILSLRTWERQKG